ncbi:hypothetical protein F3Y22_tig00112852pilonHSYRG00019 [Hibiscus syriacus]|uniref:Uncharacterized protein n=1 Tax=Hibiscus syriacus TaxID=106335 RepID=A0A6A2WTC6_HIBSY|nr:hypothetical protein F3Y22_tig00112852pilonHSYRG00019 [Hibiscus syriacus]
MRDRKLQSDFNIKGLSLIDVSSEDDCLIDSPFIDQFSGCFDEYGKLDGKLEEDETRGSGRLKLHKSMTWDSSFFCSADFLESEKFSSREYVNRSCDSSTVSVGEISRREVLKADLNEDRRASIQKSKRMPGNAGSRVKKELETKESRIVSSSKLVYSNRDKVKQKAAPKKNTAMKDPGKTWKQSVGRSAVSTSSLHKTPKVQGKGASLGAKYIKIEKDAKSVTGRGTTISKTPALDGSRNIVPRTTLSSGSSSLSSSMISISSMDMIKQNNDSSLVNLSSSGYTTTNASKSAATSKSRAGPSALSTLLKSPIKFHSSMSVASSYGEWSSESSFASSTSTANKRSKLEKDTLGSDSLKGLVADSDAQQVSDSRSHPTRRPSLGNGAEVTGSLDESKRRVSDGSTRLHPAAMKTSSGLRPPSTKLAFSNGVQSRHSRTLSVPSPPEAPISMPKTGAKSTNPRGGSNKAPPRTLQQSTSAATKVQSASRNSKLSHGISLKLQNKPSRKTDRGSYSKAQGIGSAEKIGGRGLPRLVVNGSRIKDTKVVSLAAPDD